jgi:hypothetical protein
MLLRRRRDLLLGIKVSPLLLETGLNADEIVLAFVDLFWPHFIGGCSITRDTVRWLKEAGSWSKVDLVQPEDEPPYQIIPHIMGVLTK